MRLNADSMREATALFKEGKAKKNHRRISRTELKNLWKEEFPKEYKEFKEKFHTLARKMKPQVYAPGMLPEPVIFDEYKGIVK